MACPSFWDLGSLHAPCFGLRKGDGDTDSRRENTTFRPYQNTGTGEAYGEGTPTNDSPGGTGHELLDWREGTRDASRPGAATGVGRRVTVARVPRPSPPGPEVAATVAPRVGTDRRPAPPVAPRPVPGVVGAEETAIATAWFRPTGPRLHGPGPHPSPVLGHNSRDGVVRRTSQLRHPSQNPDLPLVPVGEDWWFVSPRFRDSSKFPVLRSGRLPLYVRPCHLEGRDVTGTGGRPVMRVGPTCTGRGIRLPYGKSRLSACERRQDPIRREVTSSPSRQPSLKSLGRRRRQRTKQKDDERGRGRGLRVVLPSGPGDNLPLREGLEGGDTGPRWPSGRRRRRVRPEPPR